MSKKRISKLNFVFLCAIFLCISFFTIDCMGGKQLFYFVYASNDNISVAGSNVDDLPSKYSLYQFSSYDGQTAGLTPNVGNQNLTNICWAFASNTAFESTLYVSGMVDKSQNLNFSEVDVANYTYSSRDYESYGGGTFDIAYEYYSSGNGPVVEQNWEKYDKTGTSGKLSWESDSALASTYKQQLLSYSPIKTNYTAYESISYPSRSAILKNAKLDGLSTEQTQTQVEQLRKDIKNHIKTVGGLTATIYVSSPSNFNNTLYYCSTLQGNANHMVTIVGWDDDVTFGNYKGAYIVQNSYGTSSTLGGYLYVFYDDANIENEVKGFKRLGFTQSNTKEYNSTSNSSYQDQFIYLSETGVILSSYLPITSTSYIANFFGVEGGVEQKISTIKVPTTCVSVMDLDGRYSQNYDVTHFKVYLVNLSSEDMDTPETALISNFYTKIPIKNKYATTEDEYLFSSQQKGYYTIELDQEVVLQDNYFAIVIEYVDGIMFYIKNNEDGTISLPTFYSTQPNTSWIVYGGDEECVAPMKVSTTSTKSIEYGLEKNTEVEYDGLNHMPNLTVTFPSSYNVVYSLDQVNWDSQINIVDVLYDSNKLVSSYKVFIKIQSELFSTIIDSCNIKILPKTLNITPNARSKIYGEQDVLLTFKVQGAISGQSPTITGRLSRVNGENVGEYDIKQGTLQVLSSDTFNVGNYSVNFNETIKFSILKRDLIISPTYLTKTYGDIDQDFTFIFNNLVSNQLPSYSIVINRESGEDVGTYDFVIESAEINNNASTGFFANNYQLKLDSTLTFEITKKPLIITPHSNLSKVYGSVEEEILSFNYSGNLDGEVPSFSGTLSRVAGENAGYYEILQGSLSLINNGTFKANNYVIDFTPNIKYFITNGEISGIEIENTTAEYDGLLHTITFSFSGEGELNVVYCLGLTFDESNSTLSPIKLQDVGEYYITFKFDLINYNTKYITKKLTITPRDLVVTPCVNQHKAYGDDNNINFDYYNVVSGEIPAFSGGMGIGDNYLVGSYVIDAGDLALIDNNSFKKNNYNLVFSNGNNTEYQIVKRDLLVVPNSIEKFYGKSDPRLTYTLTNYVEADKTLINTSANYTGKLNREIGENVGEYKILLGTLQLNNGTLKERYNLVLQEEVYLQINAVDIEIIINDKTCYYGELDFNYTYSLSSTTSNNYVNGDNLNLTYTCLDDNNQVINNLTRKNQTGYIINATSNNNNYIVSAVPAKYYIIYRNYDVVFNIFDLESSLQVEHFSSPRRLPDGMSTNIDGYNFLGWKINKNDDNFVDAMNYEITENIKFYACFEAIEYSINYNLYGGELVGEAKTKYTIEDDFDLVVAQKQGYNFTGFFDNINLSGESITRIEKGTIGNLNLFASYSKIVFNITTPLQDDSFILQASDSVEYGERYSFKVFLQDAYDKSYSSIMAYAVGQNGANFVVNKVLKQNQVEFSIDNVVDNLTLQLDGITKNKYLVRFVANNNLVDSTLVEYGERIDFEDFPLIPTLKNYDQVAPNWESNTIENVTSDITVTAIYTPNVYKVTFVMNNKLYNTFVTYGEEVDTTILNQNYNLGLLEYFKFDKSLNNIEKDTIVNVTIGSNMYILYIILAVICVAIVVLIVFNSIKRTKRNKFDWWVFGK